MHIKSETFFILYLGCVTSYICQENINEKCFPNGKELLFPKNKEELKTTCG